MDDTILVVNRSTVLPDAAIQAVIPAFQQSADDFESVWKLGAVKIAFAGRSDVMPPGSWLLEIFDHTDTPGAGGYHQDQNGRVSGKVFAGDDIAARSPWTITATHELLEMIGDPFTNTLVPLPHSRLQWFREVCDPVEGNGYAYLITGVGFATPGVWVSDFVTPAYAFQGKGPYDFKSHLHAGCPALLPGGYVTLYDPIHRRYIQHFAQQADGKVSRRARQSHRINHLLGK